jgi:RES domain-containing protein
MLNVAGTPIFVPQSPIVLISVDVELQAVADLTNSEVLAQIGVPTRILRANWNAILRRNQMPTTQTIGAAALAAGLEGLIVPSDPHAGAANLVIFPDNLRAGSYVAVHDAHGFPAGTQTRIDGYRHP